MREILEPFVGKEIGINARKPFQIDSYILESVSDSHFTVSHNADATRIHIPYRNVFRILENHEEGIHVGGLFKQKHDYSLVVKIGFVVTSVPG